MADRTYTYIDGESHFERSSDAWQEICGDKAASLREAVHLDAPENGLMLFMPKVKVFWSRRFSPGSRCLYFTACSTDQKGLYDARVALQDFELEPHIIAENKQLLKQRQTLLVSHRVIEKPKGVDAALFVQLLDDAHNNRFDICHVYSSDADYGPAVEAVKRLGKRVYVYGFDNYLGDLSPLRHSATQFVDLDNLYRKEFGRKAAAGTNGTSP